MTTIVKRGLASVAGIPGTFDVIIYPLQQTGKANQNFEEETVKDVLGFTTALLARDEHVMADFGFKLMGPTSANAKAGGAFLAPYATVALSGFDLALYNSAWQNVSGADIDLANTKVGDFNVKLRKWADSTQNTLLNTTPS